MFKAPFNYQSIGFPFNVSGRSRTPPPVCFSFVTWEDVSVSARGAVRQSGLVRLLKRRATYNGYLPPSEFQQLCGRARSDQGEVMAPIQVHAMSPLVTLVRRRTGEGGV